MADFKLSKEQEDILDFVQYGVQNLIVMAVAGAGKTTTLVECVNVLPTDKSVLLLAHNKPIAETLKSKLSGHSNVKIYTLHGLGWRLFNEHFGEKPNIDDDKYRNYINHNINTIASEDYLKLSGTQKMVYKSNLFDLLDKARYNLKQSEKEIKKMATRKYGMQLIADECKMASEVLKWGTENRNTVDYLDLLYFPSQFGYFTKGFASDYIFLDEAQDASIAQQDLISRCFKRNTRMFSFGDKEQMINSWCGSDSEAFEHLKDSTQFRKDAKILPLTTNYRCGKNIIEYAKRYTTNDIHPREDAQDGEVRFEASIDDIMEGDMVLCRNAAPLMEVYRDGISLGKKMYFRGEELGKNLQSAVDAAEGYTTEEIICSMKKKLIFTWDYYTFTSGLDPRETMVEPTIVSLFDTIKTMENLPKTVTNRDEIHKFTKDVFSNEGKEGIQLSTIHRAKGLEADNVFIICPSLIPSRLARMDWEIEEERHLQYVMCTRPKNTLNFVSEREIAPHFVYAEANSFYNELNRIKEEIGSYEE